MENVVLIIHLLLALSLVGVVLLQRSEGGGLGIGGPSNAMGSRAAISPMAKVTWVLAVAFIVTSMTLTIIAAQKAAGVSVVDRIGNGGGASVSEPAEPGVIDTDGLLPPPSSLGGDAPLVPRAD